MAAPKAHPQGSTPAETRLNTPITRLLYRRTLRLVRLLAPLVLLVSIAMIFLLPISGGWLARRAEKILTERLNWSVRLEGLEILLGQGRVEASGISLRGLDGDGEEFVVGHVVLRGSLANLIAGGSRWPEEVIIESLPPIEYVHDRETGAWEPRGGFKALAGILSGSQSTDDTTDTLQQTDPTKMPGRTPMVRVNNLEILLRERLPKSQGGGEVKLLSTTIQTLELDPRPTAQTLFRFTARGAIIRNTQGDFLLRGEYSPITKRVGIAGTLSNLSTPLVIPGLGDLSLHARNLALDIHLSEVDGNVYTANLNARAGRFELAQDKVNGQRWNDENLEFRAGATYETSERKLTVDGISLRGEEVDIGATGDVILKDAYTGSATISIQKLPTAALRLAQVEVGQLLPISILSGLTSSTLALEARVRGDFLHPEELHGEARVKAGGWSVSIDGVPDPVLVNALDVTVSDSAVHLDQAEFRFGTLRLKANGLVPIIDSEINKGSSGQVSIRADGDVEQAFDFLARFGMVPTAVLGAELPVRLDASINGWLLRPQGTFDPTPIIDPDTLQGRLSWNPGKVQLRRFVDPLILESGALRLGNGTMNLERLRVALGRQVLTASGNLRGGFLGLAPLFTDAGPLRFEGDLVGSGFLDDLFFHLSREIAIPNLPSDLNGTWQLELNLSGGLEAVEAASYQARLLLDGVSATVPTPHRLVRLEGGALELLLDREQLLIRRGSVRSKDEQLGDSTIEFQGLVSNTDMRVEGRVRTHFEYVTALIPTVLNDLVMEGVVPANFWATATPSAGLPPGDDMLRCWIAFFQQPGLTINDVPGADLVLDYEARYQQEEPVSVFAREFPNAIRNIRGNATFDPEGIHIHEATADIEGIRNMRFTGLVKLTKPTQVLFDAHMDFFDANEWFTGWGEREWAREPIVYTPRWRSLPEGIPLVRVAGNITTREARVLQYEGTNVSTKLEFQGWSRIPPRLWLRETKADLYTGKGYSPEIFFQFPKGERPIMKATATLENVELQGFMDHLFERTQSMDGLMDGQLKFYGQLMNYPTYKGDATYSIRQSSVLGNVILVYWKDVIQAASKQGGRDTTVKGTVTMQHEIFRFSDMVLQHPTTTMLADGTVDFRGRMDFDVGVSVISNRLKRIPFISVIGDVWDMVGREIVSYKVQGTVKAPRYYAIPTVVDRITRLAEALRSTTSTTPPGEER